MPKELHFSQCTLPLLDREFGLRSVLELAALNDWFAQSEQMHLH
jgi:hypothetical protein